MPVIIEGSKDYNLKITSLIRQIMGRNTGRVVYNALANSSATTFIDEGEKDQAQASTRERRLGRKGSVIIFYPNTDEAGTSELKLGDTGLTMKGRTLNAVAGGFAPDEVLFHEMVHAMRAAMDGWDTDATEEFFSVLVANIYCSEKGSKRLRKDHGMAALPDEDLKPDAFLSKPGNYVTIDEFCSSYVDVAIGLSNSSGEFNPIRDYYDRIALPAEDVSFPHGSVTFQDPVITLPGSIFEPGKSLIVPSAEPLLHSIGLKIERKPTGFTVLINGFSDDRGEDRHFDNQGLSLARANAVQDWLRRHGFLSPSDDVRVNGYGSASPVASNKTVAGRGRNRRVEVTILNLR